MGILRVNLGVGRQYREFPRRNSRYKAKKNLYVPCWHVSCLLFLCHLNGTFHVIGTPLIFLESCVKCVLTRPLRLIPSLAQCLSLGNVFHRDLTVQNMLLMAYLALMYATCYFILFSSQVGKFLHMLWDCIFHISYISLMSYDSSLKNSVSQMLQISIH